MAIKGRWHDMGSKFWGGEIPIETGGIVSELDGSVIRKTRGGDQNGSIAAFAEQFMRGSLDAYTSDALRFEMFHQKVSKFRAGNYGDVSLFSQVKTIRLNTLGGFSSVSGAFDFNILKEMRIYLDHQDNEQYRKIRSALDEIKAGDTNSQDAWHLHCTFEYGFDAFLTVDTKLAGQIQSFKDKELRDQLLERVKIPSALCEDLSIEPFTGIEIMKLANKLGAFPPFGPRD